MIFEYFLAEKELKEYSDRIYTPLSENLKTTDTRVPSKQRFFIKQVSVSGRAAFGSNKGLHPPIFSFLRLILFYQGVQKVDKCITIKNPRMQCQNLAISLT